MKKRGTIRNEIDRGDRPQGAELTEADVGRLLSPVEGFREVLPIDVGKRVWSKEWGLTMENEAQRDERKAKEKK